MPLVVTQGRSQQMSFSGSGSNNASIQVTWTQDFYVDIINESPSNYSAYDILSAPGVPIVNRTVYYDSVAGTVMPFVICRNKTATQNEERLSRWTVRAQYSTPQGRGQGTGASSSQEADNEPVPVPTDLTDISPKVTVSLGETERFMWITKPDTFGNTYECARTPAGNFWSEPVMERIPTFEMKVTQYEDFISYEDMIDRKFKTNQFSWNGYDPEFWLIEQVEAEEVEVELTGGPATAALVTYTIILATSQDVPDEEDNGWLERRALFDVQYKQGSEIKLFQNDEPGTHSMGYITLLGERRGDQSGVPDYITYRTYDTIDFDSFLQYP